VLAGCHGLTLELQGLGHIVIWGSRALALLRVENWDQQYQQARERHVGKNSFEILHSGGIVGTEKVNGTQMSSIGRCRMHLA